MSDNFRLAIQVSQVIADAIRFPLRVSRFTFHEAFVNLFEEGSNAL